MTNKSPSTRSSLPCLIAVLLMSLLVACGSGTEPGGPGNAHPLVVSVIDTTDGYNDLVFVRGDGSDRRVLATRPTSHFNQLQAHPDGNRFFVVEEVNSSADRLLMRLDDDDALSAPFRGNLGQWSPDGSQIAWINYLADSGLIAIITTTDGMRADTLGAADQVAWSPDNRLAFTNFRGGVFVGGLGQPTSVLVPTDSSAWAPAWSPDGQAIAYVGVFDGQSRLGLVDPASGAITVVNEWAVADVTLWSPDASLIAFYYRSTPDLHLVEVATGVTRPVSGCTHTTHRVQWAGDGSLYVLCGWRLMWLPAGSTTLQPAGVDDPLADFTLIEERLGQ